MSCLLHTSCLLYFVSVGRRNAKDFVAGALAEDNSAPFELKEQGPGFLISDQHALPGAQTEQNGMTERQCRQNNLPTSDLNNDSKVLGKDHIDKQGGEQDCGAMNVNVGEDDRPENSPESSTGTLEGQQRVKCPKVLNAKIITEAVSISYGKRICTTSIENITIETSEDGKQKIVRCPEKHPHLINLAENVLEKKKVR